MNAVLNVTIASILGDIYHGSASFVTLPGAFGELGILPAHAPLLAKLGPGNLRIHNSNGQLELVYISGGYVEVAGNTVHVLADLAFRSSDLEQDAANEARRLAEEATARGIPVDDFAKAYAQLLASIAQISADVQSRRRRP